MINLNREFWDRRYLECPEFGSGPGSRGYVIIKKKRLVKNALEALTANSIIDIGCGDLCWLDAEFFNCYAYMGLDISSVVIERNKALFPNVNFAVHNIADEYLPFSADLCVCFDVLIHQHNYADFVNALRNILEIGKFGALISYKKSASENSEPINFRDMEGDGALLEQKFQSLMNKIGKITPMKAIYHGDIEKEIIKLFPNAIVIKIDSYRSQNVFLVTGVAK